MSDTDFWLKLAAASFGLWAVMIPIGVSLIRSAIAQTATTQEKFLSDFHAYVLQMERRVTTLEQELRHVTRSIDNGGNG
jgi:hypothetical protein